MTNRPAEPARSYQGTPIRPVRIEDDLWHAALAVAEQQGTTVSEVIRAKLREYVKEADDKS